MSKLDTSTLKPGDVVVVKMGIWIIRALIWIQATLTGKFKYRDGGHIIVVSHRDDEGRLWGIEGRPGGVGWVLVDKYAGSWGVANVDQPKSDEDRYVIVETMKQLLGTKYDYLAYLDIAFQTLGITKNWTDFKGDDVPPHVICSAIADYVYEIRKLPNPGGYSVTRFTVPAQWYEFIDKKQWNQ